MFRESRRLFAQARSISLMRGGAWVTCSRPRITCPEHIFIYAPRKKPERASFARGADSGRGAICWTPVYGRLPTWLRRVIWEDRSGSVGGADANVSCANKCRFYRLKAVDEVLQIRGVEEMVLEVLDNFAKTQFRGCFVGVKYCGLKGWIVLFWSRSVRSRLIDG